MSANTEHPIRSIDVDGTEYVVSLRLGYDGVEYIGRLWFIDALRPQLSFQDHGAVPGATVLEAVQKAKGFSVTDLQHRCHRALSEKRRFGKLRGATDDMIGKIKYLNRVAVRLEEGTLDREGGRQEIQLIQNQILEIVRTFRLHAGVEDK